MWNQSENQINLVLIRHGATASNAGHRYLGRTDEALNEAGIRALQDAKHRYPRVEILFASPMRRCLETAAILYPEREPVVIPKWQDIDFGVFEGKNFEQLQGDARYQAWLDSGGTLPFPRGESREEFINRCCEGLDAALEHLERLCKPTVGFIVHGGTIMALLSQYGGGGYYDYQVPNGGGYSCRLEKNGEEIRIRDIRKL